MSLNFESPDIADIHIQYSLNNGFFLRSLERMPDAEFEKPQSKGTASFQWIAAHLANTKCRAANSLGSAFELPWDEAVGGTTSVFKEGESYPSKAEILEIWNPVTERFLELLTQVTDVQLDQEIDFPLPSVPKTIRGLLIFLCFHEGYHIGQMGMLVKAGGGIGLAKQE